MTYGELVERVARHLGVRRIQVPVPVAALAAAAAVMRRLGLTPPIVPDQIPRLLVAKPADIAAARADLGFDPRPLEAGLARRGAPA
jgi:nucleoside-diphosphate-sugar epimerase